MADETQEIYYDIEAAANVLSALDACDPSSLIKDDVVRKMKKDSLYVMMRCIEALAESWRSTVREKKKTDDDI